MQFDSDEQRKLIIGPLDHLRHWLVKGDPRETKWSMAPGLRLPDQSTRVAAFVYICSPRWHSDPEDERRVKDTWREIKKIKSTAVYHIPAITALKRSQNITWCLQGARFIHRPGFFQDFTSQLQLCHYLFWPWYSSKHFYGSLSRPPPSKRRLGGASALLDSRVGWNFTHKFPSAALRDAR